MRYAMRFFCVLTIASQAPAQTLGLPKVDGVNGFYRLGRLSASSPLQAQATAPCSHSWSSTPVCGWGFETLYEMIAREKDQPRPTWEPELAVGYDFLNLHAKLGSNYEVFGSLQTLPSITFYLNGNFPGRHVGAYFGIGTGLITLKNVKAYVIAGDQKGKVYSISGDTWVFTPSAGINYEFRDANEHGPGFYLFAEGSWEFRNFSGVTYGLPPGVTDLPNGLPPSISASGPVFNIGFGFTFRKEPSKPKGSGGV